MSSTCLIVDLNDSDIADQWLAMTAEYEMEIGLSYCSTDEVLPMFETGSVVMMLIFADSPTPQLMQLLDSFRTRVGAIGQFQAIVSDDPSPQLMAQVYEYGIEQFFNRADWARDLAALTRRVATILADAESPEAAAINVAHSIASGDQVQITAAAAKLEEMVDYDYLAAYHKGKACEASGRMGEAIEAFQASKQLNKGFKLASTGLGESLLSTGRVDEAIAVFDELEKGNPWDVSRKISLASAYMEKQDFIKANEYIKEASKNQPDHPRVTEAKVQMLLIAGKINEACILMDTLSNVGPYFAAKLNDMGIKLSQAGKGKVAMVLYTKAHKVVRQELRYKISLNAALALHRLEDFRLALKYLSRCEKEYGSSFEKLEKIRRALTAALAKQTAAPIKTAG